MLEEYLPFIGLLVFGNIENLILASQAEVRKANVLLLCAVSIVIVLVWFSIGTFATDIAIEYSNVIDFLGGLAIFILGIQSMYTVYKSKKSKANKK